MHHGVLNFRSQIHQRLLLFDFGIGAKALTLLGLRTRKFGVQLLDPLLAEGIEGRGLFEGRNKSIFVIRTRGIEHGGYVGIDVCHGDRFLGFLTTRRKPIKINVKC